MVPGASAGPEAGADDDVARLYLTEDGGSSWNCVFQAADHDWYLDGCAFIDRNIGVVIGDPVDGRFTLLRTANGGRSWLQLPPETAPVALEGEGAYAASGSCIVAAAGVLWFGTGGSIVSRVFRSDDGGLSWAAHETGIASAPMAGIFGLSFSGTQLGFAVGGNHEDQLGTQPTLASTSDGGAHWAIHTGSAPRGYRSAVAILPNDLATVIAVGPHSGDISTDSGITWAELPGAFNTVGCSPDGSCWAAGDDGRVARLTRQS